MSTLLSLVLNVLIAGVVLWVLFYLLALVVVLPVLLIKLVWIVFAVWVLLQAYNFFKTKVQ